MPGRVTQICGAVALSAALTFVSACGSSSGGGGSGDGGSTGSAASGKKFTLRIATTLTSDSAGVAALNALADKVKSDSGGRLSLSLFPNAQLGTEPATLDQLTSGSLDGAQLSTAIVESKVPSVGVLDLPGDFTDTASALAALNGPVGKELETRIEAQHMKVLSWLTLGFRDILTTKSVDPLHMDGLKVRVPASPLYVKTLQALGANAVPIDFTEVYTSMQSGVVSGVEASPDILLQFKLNEVAKHLYVTHHLLTLQIFAVNTDQFGKLPADLQKILVDDAKSGEQAEWTATDQDSISSIDDLKGKGVEVSEVDTAALDAILTPVAKSLAQSSKFEDLYAQLKPS